MHIILFLILFSALKMSRTVAFGRDILGAPDVDIEVKKLLLKKIKPISTFCLLLPGLAGLPVLK